MIHPMIRGLVDTDVKDAASFWLAAELDEYDYLPAFQRLNEVKALRVFEEQIRAKCDVSVFESDGRVKGFVATQGPMIDRLYVHPTDQRQGVGAALLEWAKAESPEGLTLFTHQQNARARSFYEKHQFVAVKFGVSPAPECVPDVEYRWYGQGNTQPSEPV
jgi:putative acetyltransferase